MTDRSITVGSHTPWGCADHVEIKPNGIVWVSTPSHGGFYVPSHLRTEIPIPWQSHSYAGQGARGWFEEDVDWCMVALTFPELFEWEAQAGRPVLEIARETFDYWIAPKLRAEG